MNHHDHVRLLQKGVPKQGGVWTDLGAGEGAFTLALAELTGPASIIYAVDRDSSALRRLARTMAERFPEVTLHTLVADFEHPLPGLPQPGEAESGLDGIVMANSLHFVRNKAETLARVRGYLKTGGRLLMVEYNSDHGNMWVPHPFSYSTWQRLSRTCGFEHTELLATYPSRFMNEIYAAASW